MSPERLESLELLLEYIANGRSFLRTHPGDPRTTAAAALFRCRRLLLSMQLQSVSGFEDTLGGHLRTLLDTHIRAMWTLLEPGRAIKALLDEGHRQIGLQARALGWQLPPQCTGWADLPTGMGALDMAKRVDALLGERGDEALARTEDLYQTVYRTESNHGSHGGLGAVFGHIDVRPSHLEPLEVRPEVDDGGRRVCLGAVLTLYLAVEVWRAFDMPQNRFQDLAAPFEMVTPNDLLYEAGVHERVTALETELGVVRP